MIFSVQTLKILKTSKILTSPKILIRQNSQSIKEKIVNVSYVTNMDIILMTVSLITATKINSGLLIKERITKQNGILTKRLNCIAKIKNSIINILKIITLTLKTYSIMIIHYQMISNSIQPKCQNRTLKTMIYIITMFQIGLIYIIAFLILLLTIKFHRNYL